MCLCCLTHLPVQQPRAGRFLACGIAAVLQTPCSDPNKSANLSHLLTWADSSCTTATFPKYSPSILEDLSQGGTHIFSFASGLSHLLSAHVPIAVSCQQLGKIRDSQQAFTNTNTKCKPVCTSASVLCHMGWLSQQQCNLSWFVGPDPNRANLKNLKALQTPEKWERNIFRVMQN